MSFVKCDAQNISSFDAVIKFIYTSVEEKAFNTFLITEVKHYYLVQGNSK
jgi:hypothetical protein